MCGRRFCCFSGHCCISPLQFWFEEMDYPTIPEVTNPTSQLSSSILLENADDGGESISRSSSSARLNEPGSSDLTALTGDDIFRMKGLRQNDSSILFS